MPVHQSLPSPTLPRYDDSALWISMPLAAVGIEPVVATFWGNLYRATQSGIPWNPVAATWITSVPAALV